MSTCEQSTQYFQHLGWRVLLGSYNAFEETVSIWSTSLMCLVILNIYEEYFLCSFLFYLSNAVQTLRLDK